MSTLTSKAMTRITHAGSVTGAVNHELKSPNSDYGLVTEMRRHLIESSERASWLAMGTRVISRRTKQKFMKINNGDWVDLTSGIIRTPGLLPYPVTVYRWSEQT